MTPSPERGRASAALAAALRGIRRVCGAAAALAAAYLLGVVALTVAGRGLLDLTGGALGWITPGAFEQASLALFVLVFAALPAGAPGALVTVRLLISAAPPRLQQSIDALWRLVLAATTALLAWLLAAEAATLAARGDLTQDLLLPRWVFHAVAALGAAALTGVALLSAGLRLLGAPDPEPDADGDVGDAPPAADARR